MKLHLIDGTYELFRAHFAMPPSIAPDGRPVAAVRGLVQTLLALLRQDSVTHLGIAFDHVITSFRNELFDGYKTGAGTPEELLAQFGLAEQAAAALGLVVWPMVEYEADDAIATAVVRFQDHPSLDQIVICSPDKDLTQLVVGNKIVCLDRRRDAVIDQTAVQQKFGVPPLSIPDYLALVGDSADGIPGIPRWGAKSAAAMLSAYIHIENIPSDPAAWTVRPRGAAAMSASLEARRADALFYRRLTTLSTDAPILESLPDLEWRGVPQEQFRAFCAGLGFGRLAGSPHRWVLP